MNLIKTRFIYTKLYFLLFIVIQTILNLFIILFIGFKNLISFFINVKITKQKSAIKLRLLCNNYGQINC